MIDKQNEIILLSDGSSGNISLLLGDLKTQSHSRVTLTGKGQDSKIFYSLDVLCHKLNIDKDYFRKNLAYIAVINGPGSFTGLRIICSMINGILATSNSKLISISYYDLIKYYYNHSNTLILPASCRKDYFWQLLIKDSKPDIIQGNNDAKSLWNLYLSSLISKPLVIIGDDSERLLMELPEKPRLWKIENVDILFKLWLYSQDKSREKQYIYSNWATPYYGRDADVTLKKRF